MLVFIKKGEKMKNPTENVTKYEEFPGDPVYEFLKGKRMEGFLFLGAVITNQNKSRPGMPSTIITIGYKHEKTKVVSSASYNYKKILRGIKKELKFPDQVPIKRYTNREG